jgi:MoxR-like ATPase
VLALQRMASFILADERVIDYAVRITRATREWPGLSYGAGPRGAIALVRAARATALMQARDFITPDDVKQHALPALRHRVLLAPDAQLEGRSVDELLHGAVESVEAPRI